jgi:hypothetical protein
MSATDDPTQGFGDVGEDPMGSGAAGAGFDDPTAGEEAGEDPSAGDEFGEDPSASGTGDVGEDPTA